MYIYKYILGKDFGGWRAASYIATYRLNRPRGTFSKNYFYSLACPEVNTITYLINTLFMTNSSPIVCGCNEGEVHSGFGSNLDPFSSKYKVFSSSE